MKGGMNPYGYGWSEVVRGQNNKSKRDVHDVNLVALKGLVSVVKQQLSPVSAGLEALEMRRLQFELIDAQTRFTTSALEAIGRVKHMLEKGVCAEEKHLLECVLHKLKESLESDRAV